jgi:hypothetical protein
MTVQWRARHCDKADHRRGGPAHLRGPWGGNGVAVMDRDKYYTLSTGIRGVCD